MSFRLVVQTSLRCIVFAMSGALCAVGAQNAAPGNETITKEHLRADLFFLASDGMRGRLTATPENALAAEWIKAEFERMGLRAPAGTSYYQSYNLMTTTLGTPNELEVAFGGAGASTLRRSSGQDFYPQSFSATGRVQGSVVFAGFGISSPDLGYDDYRGAEIKGNVVLVVDHEPGERDPNSPFDGVVTAQAAGALQKALAAQEKGATGILFVSDVHNHAGPPGNFEATARNFWPAQTPRIDRFTLATWMEKVRIPAAQISPALAEVLVRGTGRTLAELSRSAETIRGIAAVAVPGVSIDLTTSVDRHVVPDRNVIGIVEGADPQLRDEWVLVCAHYDHNGADGNRVFNGADDDGSGIVGLIEIAEAYMAAAKAGQRPRRSIMFAAWNSEERGLLGAWAYTEQPIVPLAKIVAVLNMDMIGRNEEVPVGGGGRFNGLDVQTAESNNNAINIIGTTRSDGMKTAVENANAGIGLTLRLRYDNNPSNLMRRSDHWPFLNRGVPGIWFHTGLHPDYHTEYDRPEKINYEKIEKVARLVHQMSWDLAQQATRPTLNIRRAVTPN